jgi:hypothetical protein
VIPNEEFNRRRNARAVVTAIGLVALVVLIFAVTIAKMHRGG